MAKERYKLPKESVKLLEEMEEDIQDLREEIKRAEEVGIPLAEVKEALDKTVKLREGLLREYK